MTEREKLISVFESKPFVVFAYLFGSRATGYSNGKSDWDIAVYFSKSPQEMKGWAVFEIEAELSSAVGSTVQVINLNSHVPPVLGFQIVNEGQVLIDKDEDVRLDVTNKILRQYLDWQYYLKRHTGHDNILQNDSTAN